MPHLNAPADVDAWFAEYGWFPGRNVADLVPAIVAEIVEDSRKYGFPMEPFAAATDFLAEHAGLRLTLDARREDYLHLTPVIVWRSTPEDIAELSRHLGVRLFPVGWDSSEGEVMVIDEQGRLFFMHHTGNYYMGADKHEAMISLFHSPMRDAEDLYV
ncbi:SUKH-3 domain-containing protein [Streptomyces flavochromogenes]|uniref:SUKH-3 domain-containing protein n=1 Tax=Streptomyces flavochromogenes TaxID=68199 RepID=A0ABW6Y179_9ACTN|nr:SUKH-3 domain-containing protein [Streptomyces flavochromogenes]